jgi:hypothetical protein
VAILPEWARTRRQGYAILTVLFLLSLPLVTPRLYASDEVQYFSYLRSLWFDRDLSFENEYRHFYETGVTQYEGFRETFLERTTETGRRISFATMGSAVLWSPFYAVADIVMRVRGPAGSGPDGFSAPYVRAVAYGSAVYGWVAVLISFWMAGECLRQWMRADLPATRAGGNTLLFGPVGASIAVWAGTPLLFYMYVAPPMAHACSAFTVAAFLATWLRVRRCWSLRGWAGLGALAGLMAMVREQDLFVIAGPAVDWVWTTARRRAEGRVTLGWRTIAGPLVGASALLLAFLPQLWAYMVLNGYPGPSRLVGRKMNWMAPHAFNVLFSPHHGLFFWTPLAILAVAGLFFRCQAPLRDLTVPGTFGRDFAAGEREPRQIAVCLIVAWLSQVYVGGSVESWTVAGAFGQRRFVGLTAVWAVGLVAWSSVVRSRAARAGLSGAVLLCVWWNIGLMAQFGAGLMDRQRLDLPRNAYHTFITVPARLPELVYRYVFERTSFFRPHAA